MVEASAGRIIMIKSYLLHTVSLYKSVYFVRSDLTTEIGKREKKMEYSYTVQLQESRIEFSVLRKNTKKATNIEGKKIGLYYPLSIIDSGKNNRAYLVFFIFCRLK